MAFAVFGPGSLYVRRTDIDGSTPINIGYIQEFSIEEAAENKELFGQKQYPLVVARGTIKVTGKAKAAMVSGLALNNAYYGESAGFDDGGNLLSQGEAQTPPVSTTEPLSANCVSSATLTVISTAGIHAGMRITGSSFVPDNTYVVSFVTDTSILMSAAATGTITSATVMTFHPGVLVDQHADFTQDLGVLYSTSGMPLEKADTAVGMTTGQYYSNSAGAYLFADADNSIELLFTYAYEGDDGRSLTITNKNIGETPTFELWYATTLNAKPYVIHVFQAVSSKLGQQFKLVDFMMPEIDFGIFANPAGNVYEVHYPDEG